MAETQNNVYHRAYTKFLDVPKLSSAFEVTKAYFYLYLWSNVYANASYVDAYEVTSSWNHDTINKNGCLHPIQLREKIFNEIKSFVNGAKQHDDLTMVVVQSE